MRLFRSSLCCTYIVDCGFFFTPMISRQNVACSSGWHTWAFFMRSAAGRMKRSYLGALRVKSCPTKVTWGGGGKQDGGEREEGGGGREGERKGETEGEKERQ
jgi:hypothetical protein